MRHLPVRPGLLAGCVVAACFVGVAGCSKPAQEPAPAATAAPAADQPASPAGQPTADQPPAGSPGAAPAKGGPSASAPAATAPAPAPAPPPPPPPPPPRKYTLAAGTVLAIQTNHKLSTETQTSGDRFQASLAEPIVDGDWVVAKAGAAVDGLVVAATKGGKVKGRAELEVAITGLTLADGQHIALETALAKSTADSSKKKDAGRIAVTTGVGMAIGAIAGGGKGLAIGAAAGGAGGTALVLGTRGKPAEIPARSVLHFQVEKPVEVVEKK